MAAQQTQQMSAAQANALARAAILGSAVKMTQQIYSANIVPANTPVVNINPRNVGLVLGFWLKVVHTISNASAVQIDLTDFGPANAISMVQFQDLQNNTRIQTPGWHLHFINSVRNRRPFGTALIRGSGYDSPIAYSDAWTGQISAPAIIPAGDTGTMTMWYWIPLAYTEHDLRGSVYMNVVNAVAQLQLSMPGSQGVSVAVANGTDSTQALYVGDVAGSVSAVTITNTALTLYQQYYDQLPVGKNGLILPIVDLATIYELKQTVQSAIVPGTDFPYQYANFRDFLSTVMVYVNTAATGARTGGTDMNYLALQSANFTNIWKKNPDLIAMETRNFLQTDPPFGVYYFGSRERPISTTQYGNMQLILNASTAGTGAYQLVGVEDFALQQSLSMAGSLASS